MSEWLIVGVALIAAILFLVYQANKEPEFKPVPPKEVIKMDLTAEQLKNYDGIQSKNTFLALKGTIYDVTGSSFYEPGSGYHSFTGKDASINLAKMSHDEQFYNKYGEITLDQDETQVLNDWVARFDMKYKKVGVVIKKG